MSRCLDVAAIPIGMSAPDIGERERELVLRVLGSGVLSIGPMVDQFEALVAERFGVRHAVAVSSGTAALHECVIATGLRAGDEVLTTAFSFVASANSIVFEGAVPVFVDVDTRSLNIDPDQLESRITARTRAVMPVHAFGQPADMDPLLDIARRHHLVVIEDACEAIGAEYKGRPAGTLGDAGVFAFYPNKQITTAEGGIIITNRDEVAGICRSLRNQGRDDHDGWLQHSRLGYNYRLSELHAALGIAQMERFDELMTKRECVAAAYTARLSGNDRIEVPVPLPSTTRPSWFVYVVRLDSAIDRDAVIVSMQQRGIPTRPYFPPIHLQPFYRERFGCVSGSLPVTEREARRTLALPFHANLTDEQVQHVCDVLFNLTQ